MRQTPATDAETRTFLARLEREHKAPAGESDQPRRKSLTDFARLAVDPLQRRQQRSPAAWTVDRNEYIKHYTGTTFIAVGAIAKKVAQQEAIVCRRRAGDNGQHEDEVVSAAHPLCRLFRDVNQIHTQFDLWYQMVAWRLITGDSFWWKTRNGFGVPVELWPLPSQWVWAIPSHDKYIAEYLVRGVWGRDTYLSAADVLHIREPTIDWAGSGRFYGRPVAKAGATAIDLENQMFSRLYHQFKNFAPPGLHYHTDEELSESQFLDLMAQIRMQHGQAEQTGEPIFSHTGMQVSEFRQSVREMDYSQSLTTVMDYLLAIYGTPKAVVGLSKDYNKANLIGATMAWIENTINPLLLHLGQHLTQHLASDFGDDLVVKFQPCTVSDRDALRKDVETCLKAEAMTPNEVRGTLMDKPAYAFGGDRPVMQGALREAPFGNAQAPLEPTSEAGDRASPSAGDDSEARAPDEHQEKGAERQTDSPLEADSDSQLKRAASEVVASFFRTRRRLKAQRRPEDRSGHVDHGPQAARAEDGGGAPHASTDAETPDSKTA